MRRQLILIGATTLFGSFAGVFAGCSHDISAMFGAEAKTTEADALLAAANIRGAREKYREVLADFPNAPNALFGAALTDLMLMAEAKPVTDLTDLCGEEPLDLAGILFGPTGIIAQSVESREGEAALEVHYFAAPGEGAVNLLYRPTDVRSRVDAPVPFDPRRYLNVSLRERDVANSRWMFINVNIDDIAEDDEAITPLVDGAEVEVAKLSGYVDLLDFSRSGSASGSPSGKLRFTKVGREPGDELQIDFIDVRLPAPPLDLCGADCGPAWYTVSGRVVDRLSAAVDIDSARVPFGNVMADDGAPRRPVEVVAMEKCQPLDDRFVADRLIGTAELVEADAQLLATLLASPERDDFTFEIPSALLRSPGNLPVNLTDVRALQGALQIGAAFAEIAAEYQWLAGDIQAQIEEQDWYYEGETAPARTKVFWPATLVTSLETGFFTKPAGFDLSRARDRLRAGTAALAAAMGERPTRAGLFDFAARPSSRLVGELAGVFQALHDSIDSEAPVPLPSAPLYTVHMKHFFDDPLDAARVRQVAGLLRLWSERPGDPSGIAASDKNPDVSFELDVAEVRGWSDGLVTYPSSDTVITCGGGTACPSGYSCAVDRCELDPPWFATEDAWRSSASRFDWPAFVSNALRDALAVDL